MVFDTRFDIRNAGKTYSVIKEFKYIPTPSTGIANNQLCNEIDIQAEHEGNYIAHRFTSHTIDFGKRLKRLYKQGDDKFSTGAKHRMIGRNY